MKRLLFLDIGDSSAKFAIVQEGTQKKLLETGLFEYPRKEPFFFEQNLAFVCKELAQEKVERAVLMPPPSLCKSRIAAQSIQRKDASVKISLEEKQELQARALQFASQDILSAFALESGILPRDLTFSNLQILSLAVDGYEVADMAGLKGRALEFSVLGVVLAQKHQAALDRILKTFTIEREYVVHEGELLLRFARKEKREGLFLDIGGAVTQLFLLKDGKLTYARELKMGGELFTDVLESHLGMGGDTARQLKEEYGKGVQKKIQELLKPQAKLWQDSLKKKLEEDLGWVPGTLYLYGGGGKLVEVQESLQEVSDVLQTLLPQDITSFPLPPSLSYTPLALLIEYAYAQKN